MKKDKPRRIKASETGFKHMAMNKAFLIQTIRAYGAKTVMPDWTGTDAQAIKAVEADPRDYFTGCDNTAPNGECLGHRREKKQ